MQRNYHLIDLITLIIYYSNLIQITRLIKANLMHLISSYCIAINIELILDYEQI